MTSLPALMMPEAETSLRLAFYLLQSSLAESVDVAIDGAQVRTLNQVHFAIERFLRETQCKRVSKATGWRGMYRHTPSKGLVRIHSSSGRGDVVAKLHDGRTFRAECKKGPLVARANSHEYSLLREALGQLLTITEVAPDDLLAVAVPHSEKLAELAERWRQAPLVQRTGIQILTVTRGNEVDGLQVSSPRHQPAGAECRLSAEQAAALARTAERMRHGHDLGGRMPPRDELHER